MAFNSLYHAGIDIVKTEFFEASILAVGGITRASENKLACFLSQLTRKGGAGNAVFSGLSHGRENYVIACELKSILLINSKVR